MRGEVGKETPKKEMELLTTNGLFFGQFVETLPPLKVSLKVCRGKAARIIEMTYPV